MEKYKNKLYQLPTSCSCGYLAKSSDEVIIHICKCNHFIKRLINDYGVDDVILMLKENYQSDDAHKAIEALENNKLLK